MINETLDNLVTFGDVAAEDDDSVLNYFVSTSAVNSIQDGECFLVLGRKGSGKTALVRYFTEGTHGRYSKAVNLKNYPWAIHAARIDYGATKIEAFVASWSYLMALQFAILALVASNNKELKSAKQLIRFLNDNYGGLNPSISDIMRPKSLRLSRGSIEPTVLGNKLGSISFEREKGDLDFGTDVNALSDRLISIALELSQSVKIRHLYLQIDELDQGMSELTDERRQMITGLIIGARKLTSSNSHGHPRLNPIIYLRSDIWESLSFSDKNKISTSSTLALDWNSDKLKEIIDERLKTLVRPSAEWDRIHDGQLMRGAQSKWNHLITRTFMRPRDVIQFCNCALASARKRTKDNIKFINQDITDARESYSAYLKNELDDEIKAHWPLWEQALQACSQLSTITFTKEDFTREYLIKKSQANTIDPDRALELLYLYSVIGYEKRFGYGGQTWVYKYLNPESGWDNAAIKFKVHLGLKEFAKLREERSTTTFNEKTED